MNGESPARSKKYQPYWRSLEDLADTPEVRELVRREFPEGTVDFSDPLSRRSFLALMGASLALAGLAGCRRPVEKIIPYVIAPEDHIPGNPEIYATTLPAGLTPVGITVECHEGRPVKIEGNSRHPASGGAADAFVQAGILELYDPDRSQLVRHGGQDDTWEAFMAAWRNLLRQYQATGGDGLALLSETFSSPTLRRLQKDFMTVFPRAEWVTWEPVSDETLIRGINGITGKTVYPVYHYDKARVILALDSDFLHLETDHIRAARQFSRGRQVDSELDSMNRLYVVESSLSVTGSNADHRLCIQSGRIAHYTAALVHELTALGVAVPGADRLPTLQPDPEHRSWLRAVAADLIRNRQRGVIVAGHRQPAEVHALVYLLNSALGNNGITCTYHDFPYGSGSDLKGLIRLVHRLRSGAVSTLIMLGGNPVYAAPADLDFPDALQAVSHSIHLSSHVDETSAQVEWHIPRTHALESWGDAATPQGCLSVIQPLIEPLFKGKSEIEVLTLLTTGEPRPGYEIVRDTWQAILPAAGFEDHWRRVLHDGLHQTDTDSGYSPRIDPARLQTLMDESVPAVRAAAPEFEIVFTPSHSVFDGRYANLGWLQELPDPVTKLTWDNAALLSRETARVLGVTNEDLITIAYAGRSVEMPVWIMPGQADNSITVALGYGRRAAGRIGNRVGRDVYVLRTSDHPGFVTGGRVDVTGRRHKLACTQDHQGLDLEKLASEAIQKRLPVIIREATLEEYRRQPDFAHLAGEYPPWRSLWTERPYDEGYQWGMAIDLTRCTGCSACTIACQSENNIPVVGKREVARGREMHWLRLDRYFRGNPDQPEVVFQPVACQHCENAPCEQVCPVAATVHDREGLNVMTYNRCVGTRYCANNCPYKVRRFNFFNFTSDIPEIVRLAMNPDVTVRSRGVMEKCSFCVQRISRARILAKRENRDIREGEVVTACQQTCPSEAIVFGNINDSDSEVSRIKRQNRNYALLGELNTKPRTTFLAKLRNPNPELEGKHG